MRALNDFGKEVFLETDGCVRRSVDYKMISPNLSEVLLAVN